MTLSIIGLGLSARDLTEYHLSIIRNADVLAGGTRHLNYFPNFPGKKIEISKDLKGLTENLRQLMAAGLNIVVLASGDPLFYGIGAYLCQQFGKDSVRICPNISSVAAAFSRISTPWHDAKVISCHGRAFEHTRLNDFRMHNKLAVLTDPENTPSRVFNILTQNKIADFNICILECLGEDSESVQWFAPGETIAGEFREPNIMIFIRECSDKKELPCGLYPGMPDHLFRHDRGMITKSEIRVVTLSKLMLENNSIFWDLGAGSGSISIEASLYVRAGRICAVEKNKTRVSHIKENQGRFNVPNLEICHGILPDVIEELPDPDRVFIGGGGADLVSIIKKSVLRLLPNGIIVINTVLLKNMCQSLDLLEHLDFDTEIIQMQINHGHKMPWNQMLKSQNPVWILRGVKKNG